MQLSSKGGRRSSSRDRTSGVGFTWDSHEAHVTVHRKIFRARAFLKKKIFKFLFWLWRREPVERTHNRQPAERCVLRLADVSLRWRQPWRPPPRPTAFYPWNKFLTLVRSLWFSIKFILGMPLGLSGFDLGPWICQCSKDRNYCHEVKQDNQPANLIASLPLSARPESRVPLRAHNEHLAIVYVFE